MTKASQSLILDVLSTLAEFGKVQYSQRDPRWNQAIQAHEEFSIACGKDPEVLQKTPKGG